jgi:hypothetical protein
MAITVHAHAVLIKYKVEMSEVENPAEPESSEPEMEQRMPLPPATFEFLALSIRTQAELQLGLIHFGPESERPKPDLDLARHSIDLLGVLQDKTKGNLTLEEQRLLENSLTELRFRFVQALEESKKS